MNVTSRFIIVTILIANLYGSSAIARQLGKKHQSIVHISSLTTVGNLPALKIAMHNGLDNGLTINEIKEILIQLYAYCGFPRSLNAINTFNAVVTERHAKGINDQIGVEPIKLNASVNRYEEGKKNLAQLTKRSETGPKTGFAAFVPDIEVFLKEHLFADIFSRGVLTNQERELVTVSCLSSLGNVEAQLQSHLSICIGLGLSEEQLSAMLVIIESNIGKTEAALGRAVLAKAITSNATNR